MSYEEQVAKSQDLIEDKYNFGVAIASNNGFLSQADSLYKIGIRIFLVDTANGHSDNAINAVKELSLALPDAHIMAGNVATYDGFKRLAEVGADSIRVGIGGGSVCTTRIVSGHGVPTAHSISEVALQNEYQCSIIADGGIKYSGDIVKALAAGAGSVMIGSLFAGTDESPGELIIYQGKTYKSYRGMGSLGAMSQGSKDRYFQANINDQGKFVPEGIEGRVAYKGPLSQQIYQLVGGIRSAMGYTGSKTIHDLQTKTEFVRISNAALRESHVHDVYITREAPNYKTDL
jgi:IMP dehydrogenase